MHCNTQNIDEIYKDSYDLIRASLLKYCSDEALLEDVIQEGFIKLWANLKKGNNVNNPESWLIKVIRNIIIDYYRKKHRHVTLNVPISNDIAEVVSESKKHGPEDCLLGIVSDLPLKYKKAVYLTDIKGVSQKESAYNLKLPLSTFKSHVQRGRKLVLKGYQDCCGYNINDQGLLVGEPLDCKRCSASDA